MACYHALRNFVRNEGAAPGLYGDLREDLVAALECFIDCIGRSHAALNDVGMGLTPNLLGIALAPGRSERIVERHRWVQRYFRYVGLQTRHFVAEPPWVVLHDLRNRRRPTTQTSLEVLVHYLRLHEVLHKILGHLNVLRTLWDHTAAGV